MTDEPTYKCPTCGRELELYANGDDGAHQDRWTCEACGIEYPHTEFPLPPGYVRAAREIERAAERKWQEAQDRRRLDAWNAGKAIR